MDIVMKLIVNPSFVVLVVCLSFTVVVYRIIDCIIIKIK